MTADEYSIRDFERRIIEIFQSVNPKKVVLFGSFEKALKVCLYSLGQRRVIGHSLFELCKELTVEESRFSAPMGEAKQLSFSQESKRKAVNLLNRLTAKVGDCHKTVTFSDATSEAAATD